MIEKKEETDHTRKMKNNNRQAQKSCSLLSLYKKAMLSAASSLLWRSGGGVGTQGITGQIFSFAREIIRKMTDMVDYILFLFVFFFQKKIDAQFGRPSPTRHLDTK